MMPVRNDIPGLKRLPKPGGAFTWYWSVLQITRRAEDFRPRTFRLWHGIGEPTAAELAQIREQAETLNFDLREWQLRTKPNRKQIAAGKKETRRRGFIYVVRAGERVKIGFSKDVSRRLSEMQVHSPDDLELLLAIPGSHVTERALHARFARLTLRGEWFRYEEPIAAFVQEEMEQKLLRGIQPKQTGNDSEKSTFQNRGRCTA